MLGMYALSLMEKEGHVHGYRVTERIAERTEGAWRPGAGAVYPALRRLVERGLARPSSRSSARRRDFEITPQGRALLHRLRSHGPWMQGRSGLDLTPLWAEVTGVEATGDFLLLRLRRALDSLDLYLARPSLPSDSANELRTSLETELDRYLQRLRRPSRRPLAVPRGGTGGGA